MAREILGTSRLSHKFQVTVPKDARERFEMEAGDKVVFIDDDGELTIEKGKQK